MISELFINNCGEKIFEKRFSDLYSRVKTECATEGVFFLSEDYIRSVQEKTDAYPRIFSLLTEEANRIDDDASAKEYALFVFRAMQDRTLFLENIKYFELPVEKYPFFAFLCLVPMIENTHRVLSDMGIDKDIISATVRQYEECVFIYSRRFDRLGMNKKYFDWLQHYVDCEILNINRLRFEIYRLTEPLYMLRNTESGEDVLVMGEGEFNSDGLYSDTPPKKELAFTASFTENDTEYIAFPVSEGGRAEGNPRSYSKDRYKVIIKKGDYVLSVHIPVEGELSHEATRESYKRANEVFAKFFPEIDFKGFCCHSWMMSPELSLYMKEGSRVLGFASQYKRFPIHTEGEDVLNFVFYLKFKTYEDLAEDTSLQRKLKRLYLDGGRLYEYGGIFARDKIK